VSFWSAEKLAVQLPPLISNFDAKRIDCAAYTLSIGEEIFLTVDQPTGGGHKDGVREKLANGQSFKIPPGQFAFLLTEEVVKVPNNALAFISMKARYKFMGLVNVSGFHVDPGWNGQLTFSVYNAGPAPVHLRRGLPLFLIWYSDLDQTSGTIANSVKNMPSPSIGLKDTLMANMSGQVFSPINLGNQLINLREGLMTVKSDLASFRTLVYGVGGLIVAIFVMVLGLLFEPARDFVIKEFAEHREASKTNSPTGVVQEKVDQHKSNSNPSERKPESATQPRDIPEQSGGIGSKKAVEPKSAKPEGRKDEARGKKTEP